MKTRIKTDRKKVVLAIKVQTNSPSKVRVRVSDSLKPFTYYTNRWNTVDGEATFFVNMPQSPKWSTLEIKGNLSGKPKVRKMPLKQQFGCMDADTRLVRRFLKFSQHFAENAGILEAGRSIYESDDGKFVINYLDIIRNDEGRKMKTPARVSQTKGIIEVSKWHFKKYTVPMRMAILLHEFSHYYINREPSNETEADLHALIVYLGMGYPKIDAHMAFLKVFKDVPSDGNKERYDTIEEFIENFERFTFKKCA